MSTPTPDITQILADLQRPDAYPHPVRHIHAVQTHGSCVFLTGDFVYKIKKPVNFGFLDYSTLERRHHFCAEELRLNRRLCPDLYLDLLPITFVNGRLQIGGEGEPVEWAVQMRQLREEEMLPARLAAGTANKLEIERLAHVLADFHANAPSNPPIAAFGMPDGVARVTATTLETMDRVAGAFLSEQTRSEIRAALETTHKHPEPFDARVLQGRIRDCHGDLRAQNIGLDPRYDNGIQVFDCIEFNEEFRYIDTAADIAYLAMDLDLAGRADLRVCLIETYRQAANDATLLSVLDYYRTYRAVVRGNIALLAGEEPELGEGQRQAQRELASAAYDLAWCSARRRSQPALLITVGFSGSGKSAMARELARRLPAIVFVTDRIRKELAGIPETAVLGQEWYTPEKRREVYAEIYRRAEAALRQGEHVLLDATFLGQQDREEAADLAAKCGAEFWILDCQVSDAIIRERLKRRSRSPNASDAGIAVYEEQRRAYQPIQTPLPGNGHLIVVNLEQTAKQAAHEAAARFIADGE